MSVFLASIVTAAVAVIGITTALSIFERIAR